MSEYVTETCRDCADVLDYQLDYDDWFACLKLGKGFRCALARFSMSG